MLAPLLKYFNMISMTERQNVIVSERVLKQCYLRNNMDADRKQQCIYVIVIYVVIIVNYCKCVLMLYI